MQRKPEKTQAICHNEEIYVNRCLMQMNLYCIYLARLLLLEKAIEAEKKCAAHMLRVNCRTRG